MIDTNVLIIEFIGKNFIAIGAVLGLLKILVAKTPGTEDDEAVGQIEALVNRFRPGVGK